MPSTKPSLTPQWLEKPWDWSDYWTKMATQVAGKNMADVIQMDYRYIAEYARRGGTNH